jgi:hypothetical protein
MNTQRFSLIYGIVFLLVGLAGFVPGVVQDHGNADVGVTAGLGLLLGLFPVNVLHNLVHLLFGAWGLAASRSTRASVGYAKSVAVIYAIFVVMGLITAGNLHTTFGLVPLYGHDVWLHALLALGAAYFGFVRREPAAADHRDPVPEHGR